MLGLENPYAQTNVQLFEQLRSEGYTGEERARVADAYEFAMNLFTGIYLPSGKPFIDHLVGTASVLASLHMPVEVVAAGLIHAAYIHGDFGGVRKGAFAKNRKLVRKIVGEEVEEYVVRYDRLSWGPEKLVSLHDGVKQLSQVERKVLLIRLANELEHELDLGGLRFARNDADQQWHQRYIETFGPKMAEMARTLGYSALAVSMETVFRSVTSAPIPLKPRRAGAYNNAYLIVPGSYRINFRHACVTRACRIASSIRARIMRIYRHALT